MLVKKISFIVLISLIFLSCNEEPPKSEFDMLRDYCGSAHEEFIEKYNTQREIEDAELLMFADNFEPFKDILPMSLMGSAKLIDTMINGGDCFTKFDWSEELEWKIDDYIYYGGSCEALMQYLNVTYLDECEQDWNPRYAPRLPIIFNNGERLDYEKHYQEFVEYGNLAGYKLFLQLDIATTVARLMGFDNMLGLGVDLLASTSSVAAKPNVEEYLQNQKSDIMQLWDFPNATDDVAFEEEHLVIDKKRYNFPILFQLKQNGGLLPFYKDEPIPFFGRMSKFSISAGGIFPTLM